MAAPSKFDIATAAEEFAGPGRSIEIKAEPSGEFARRQMLLTVNGWTFSAVWGFGTYSTAGRLGMFGEKRPDGPSADSPDAEVMVWRGDGHAIDLHGDSVEGWISPAALLAAVAATERGARSTQEAGIRAALVRAEDD